MLLRVEVTNLRTASHVDDYDVSMSMDDLSMKAVNDMKHYVDDRLKHHSYNIYKIYSIETGQLLHEFSYEGFLNKEDLDNVMEEQFEKKLKESRKK